jgi:hypothetical protein
MQQDPPRDDDWFRRMTALQQVAPLIATTTEEPDRGEPEPETEIPSLEFDQPTPSVVAADKGEVLRTPEPTGDSSKKAQDTNEELERLEKRALAQQAKLEQQGKQVKLQQLPQSTIKYPKALAQAAALTGVELESHRKPHSGGKGGSSGTDHQRADGKSAVLTSKPVMEKIEKKTGAKMSLNNYVKLEKVKAESQKARDEKKLAINLKKIEVLAEDQAEFRSWCRHLASTPAADEWRQRMQTLRNTIYVRGLKSRDAKKLELIAKKRGWPTAWEESLANEVLND